MSYYFTTSELEEAQDVRDALNGWHQNDVDDFNFLDRLTGVIRPDSSLIAKDDYMCLIFHFPTIEFVYIFSVAMAGEVVEAHKELSSGHTQLLRVVEDQISDEPWKDGVSCRYAIDIDAARRAVHGSTDPEDLRHLRLLWKIFK
jgi:hypothetical protein